MRVLLVQADADMLEEVTICLRVRWPNAVVCCIGEGAKAAELVETESPDMVILALDLPDMDGLEVVRQIRSFSDVPILILTVRDGEMDRVKALELGADDYITKPFGAMDLLSRTKAVLRRAHMPQLKENGPPPFCCSDLWIDFASRKVCVSGEVVKLTPKEYALLYQLVRNEGRVLSHRMLLERVWGSEYDDTSFLKKYVHRLRVKLKDNLDNPQTIQTEHGVGYRFIRPG